MAIKLIKRGALIVIEGVDKVGKTTQCQRLVRELNDGKHRAEYWKYPRRDTPTGSLINQYLTGSCMLDDHVIHLLFSANRWETAKQMKEKLEEGITLIVDRYAFSGAAYSAAKEKNIPLDWCKSPDCGLPRPDLVVYLTARSAESRPGFGGEIYENEAFQSRVKKMFDALKDDSWKVFESEGNMDELTARIYEAIKDTIKDVSQEIKPLWSERLHV
ncbi:thymidylate kinase [Brevipalpus obovatus]|uniref:thymidylate kinase n=1 Tax=Brevipalpus obovatus TaxID=246614 RepID=UPI003D9E6E28